jgi:hypothetical protein
MKKIVLGILVVLVLGYFAFDKISNVGLTKEFTHKQDSLVHEVDSLILDIKHDDSTIMELNEEDGALLAQLNVVKSKTQFIVQHVETEKAKINNLNDTELVSTFNKRYPTDTISNKLEVAKPVLVSTAKDLVEFDGAKELLKVKDTIIGLDSLRLNGKDSIITTYVKKEGSYKKIVSNQSTQISDWKFQYNTLQLENQKLKFKNKFTKIAAGIVIGGITYMMLTK